MRKELKEKALQLRLEKQLSYSAIMKELSVAKSTLSEWLRPFPLSKEKILELQRINWKNNEVKIELFRATMREKREQNDKEEYEKYLRQFRKIPKMTLFASGLMLYLAEGAKTSYYTVSIANTDSRIIKFFIKWLEDFFKIPKEKIRAQLHLYENMDIEKEKSFWKNELNFADKQFYKSYITHYKKNSFLYKESFRHGTCSVYFSNTIIKRRIMMGIKAYVDSVLLSK